jgi:cation:H+ antiporter
MAHHVSRWGALTIKTQHLIHLLQILGLVGAAILLWQGADLLVNSAAKIARGFGISDLIVGLTIVAMGTSAPELAVSVTAALDGEGAVALGNVVGSNIFNLGIVLGGAALLAPLKLNREVVYRDGGLLLLSTLTLWYFLRDGSLDRVEGGTFVGAMICYLLFLAARKSAGQDNVEEEGSDPSQDAAHIGKDLLTVLIGITMVVGGGKLLVTCAVALATAAGMSPWLVSVTVVAAGTSAPEMVTTFAAVRGGHHGMAIGGLFGSDIFNVLLVLGVASLVAPMTTAFPPLQDLSPYQNSVLVMAASILGTLALCGLRGGLGKGGGSLIILVAITRWGFDIFGV